MTGPGSAVATGRSGAGRARHVAVLVVELTRKAGVVAARLARGLATAARVAAGWTSGSPTQALQVGRALVVAGLVVMGAVATCGLAAAGIGGGAGGAGSGGLSAATLIPPPSPRPSPSPAPSASPSLAPSPLPMLVATPVPSPVAVVPPPQASPPPQAFPSPQPIVASPSIAPVATLVFADSFDEAAAWPVGDLAGAHAAVRAGRYVLTADPSAVPVIVRAAWPGQTIGPVARVGVRIDLAYAGTTRAGLAAGNGDGSADLVFLASADGRWHLALDTTMGYEDLAAGDLAALAAPGMHTMTLDVGAAVAAASIDGVVVARVAVGSPVASFGLTALAADPGTDIAFDDFEVFAVAP